jgi:hypothetical protein
MSSVGVGCNTGRRSAEGRSVFGLGSRSAERLTELLDRWDSRYEIHLPVVPEQRQVFLFSGTVHFGPRSCPELAFLWVYWGTLDHCLQRNLVAPPALHCPYYLKKVVEGLFQHHSLSWRWVGRYGTFGPQPQDGMAAPEIGVADSQPQLGPKVIDDVAGAA